MRVLVAEDNEASRLLLVKVLQAYGHEVTAVANGAEALEQALKEPPDILVTDILMPKMDGYQLCHEWRQNDRLKDIPFVFYTATYTTDEDERFALSLGCSTFIRKPTEPDVFVQILCEVFEKAKSGLLPPLEVAPLEPSLYLTEYNKRIVAKLNDKVAQLEEAEEKLRHANSVLRAIRDINQLIVQEKDRVKILQGACEMLTRVRECKFAWVGLIEEGHKRILPAAQAGVEEDYLNSLRVTWDDSETGKGPTGTAIKTRQPSIMNNIPEDPRYKPWREEALKWGYASWAAIPLVHDEKVYGALNIYSILKDGFDGEEVQLLVALGGDIAFALKAIDTEENRKQAEEQLEHSFIDLAETVSRAMGSRDPYTSEHQRRVAELARLVGEKMGLDEDSLQGLYIGGLLHDIGKISMPESILTKPGTLTQEEWGLIRSHAKRGYDILKDTELPWPVAEMALHHHERLDGSGYPDGLSGDQISLEARILAVCDVVEAMSSFRPYRPARSLREVLGELRGGRGTKYDPNVADIMLEIVETGGFELKEI